MSLGRGIVEVVRWSAPQQSSTKQLTRPRSCLERVVTEHQTHSAAPNDHDQEV